jgi:hypothetical protein
LGQFDSRAPFRLSKKSLAAAEFSADVRGNATKKIHIERRFLIPYGGRVSVIEEKDYSDARGPCRAGDVSVS